MRAREKHKVDTDRLNAMTSIEKGVHQGDPSVIENFNRPPYYPVLNFMKGGKKK